MSGLYYAGARFYSADLGRFLSADPIVPGAGDPQALNRYAYVRNNPLRYTDPTGMILMDDPGGATQCMMTGSCGGSGPPVAPPVYGPPAPYPVGHGQGPDLVGYNVGQDWLQQYCLGGFDCTSFGVPGTGAAIAATFGFSFLGIHDQLSQVMAWWRSAQSYLASPSRITQPPPKPPAPPSNQGFFGEPTKVELQRGTRIDRYGPATGRYTSPAGTPFEQRALPPGRNVASQYHIYEVVKPVTVEAGPIRALETNASTGGHQYILPDSVHRLIQAGVLKEVK